MVQAQILTARKDAIKRFQLEKIIKDDAQKQKCISWLAQSGEDRDSDISEFLETLDSCVLDVVINDESTQVRHDELPIAYRYIKSLLLTQKQKKAGLQSGEFRRNCLEKVQSTRSGAEQTMREKVFLFEAIQRSNIQGDEMINENANALDALDQIFQGDGNNVPSTDNLLSIFSTPLTLSEAQLSELEGKMAQCLARTCPVSVEQIRGFEVSSFASESLAKQVTMALFRVYYIQKQKLSLANSQEEVKIDTDNAIRIISGVETILAALFKALTMILVDQQMQSVCSAIDAGNHDAALLTNYNHVLTVDGSIAACTQFICLFLCTNGAFEGRLHKVANSISACRAFCQLQAKLDGDSELKKSLEAINAHFSFTIGAVAYRVFRETKNIQGDNPLLELTSLSGRKIDPNSFRLQNKSSRVAELEQTMQSFDDLPQLWTIGQNVDDVVDFQIQQLLNNELSAAIDSLQAACKVDQNISPVNFVKRMQESQKVEKMPILKAALAVLVNFHPDSEQLKTDLQSQICSDNLKQLWAEAGNVVGSLHNAAKNQYKDRAVEITSEFMKKATILASIKVKGSQNLLKQVRFADYELNSDELSRRLEEVPYEAFLKRSMSFGLFRKALEACHDSQPDIAKNVLSWFSAAMRSCNQTQISYATGLPLLSESLESVLKQKFDGIIKKVASFPGDSSVISEALCWSYSPKDFECLEQECQIFSRVDQIRMWWTKAQGIISCEVLSAMSCVQENDAVQDQLTKIGLFLFDRIGQYLLTGPQQGQNLEENKEEKGVPCNFCSYQLPLGQNICKFTNIGLTADQSTQPNQEVVVWQAIQALDLLACLTKDKAPNLLDQLFTKENMSLILRLSIESSDVNQILCHRLIQNLVTLSSNVADMLEGATSLIEMNRPCYQTENELVFENSAFFQLLLNQSCRADRMSATTAEIARTFQVIISNKNDQQSTQSTTMKAFLQHAFSNIADYSEQKLDLVFSLVPEMAAPKISTGSICQDQEANEHFTVLGYCKNSYVRTDLHPSGEGTDRIIVKGLSIESEKTQFHQKKLINLKPLFASDEEAQARQSLVFHDKTLLQQIIAAIDANQNPLYRSHVVRGFSNMIKALKNEYIDFLEAENLLAPLIEKIKPIASQVTVGLKSIEVLQQLADNIRKESMLTDNSAQEEAKVGPRPAIEGGIDYNFSKTYGEKLVQNFDDHEKVKDFFLESESVDLESMEGLSSQGLASTDQCLILLGSLRARQILITILSERPAQCQALSEQQIFQLIHDEHSIASNSGFHDLLKMTEERIGKIIDYLKSNGTDQAYNFVTDLLERGQLSIQRSFNCAETNRSGSHLLYPGSLAYFTKVIQDKQLVKETAEMSVHKMNRVLFDLMIALGFGYSESNPKDSLALFKAAKDLLEEKIADNLAGLSSEEALEFLNNKLIFVTFFQLVDEDYGLIFSKKSEHIREIVKILKSKSEGYDFKLKPDEKWEKVEQMFRMLTEGPNCQSLLSKIERDLLLKDLKARSVTKSWGSMTKSDQYIYDNVEMKMKVQAHQEEKQLTIYQNFDGVIVNVTQDGAEERVESGKRIIISPNTEAMIEVKQNTNHPTLVCSGWLDVEDEIKTKSWKTHFDTSQMKLTQAYGEKNWFMLVCEDGKMFMMGREKKHVDDDEDDDQDEDEAFGKDEPEDDRPSGKLREVKKPNDCMQFKKVLTLPEQRMILTEQGKLFFSGDNAGEILQLKEEESGDDEASNGEDYPDEAFKEVDILNTFKKYKEEYGKIIDFALGQDSSNAELLIVAIVTENGRLFAINDTIRMKALTSKEVDKSGPATDKSYEIYKDQNLQWKVSNVFCRFNQTEIIFTAKKDGQANMFSVTPGDNNRPAPMKEFGKDLNDQQIVLQKIVSAREKQFGLDANKNLWFWGDDHIDGLFDNAEDLESRELNQVVWFREQGLDVIDIEAGSKAILIKTQSVESGELSLYGIPRYYTEDLRLDLDNDRKLDLILQQSHDMIAFEDHDSSKSKGHTILKLSYSATNIRHMACSSFCTFLVLDSSSSEGATGNKVNPPKQDGDGLLHYYKNSEGSWTELKQSEYEAQKQSLPNFCFATHYPIRDQSSRDYLSRQWDLVNFQDQQEESKFHNGVRTTAKSEQVSHDNPLYYSFTVIDDQEQKVFAKEEEVLGGDQIWDLNPLIFYRLKKPVQDLNSLPQILISEVYNQNRQAGRMILINERVKMISQEQLRQAFDQADDMTKEAIKQIRNFTPENDLKIIEVLEEQLKTFLSDARTLQLNNEEEKTECSPGDRKKSLRQTLRLTRDDLGLSGLVSPKIAKVVTKLQIDKFKFDSSFFHGNRHIDVCSPAVLGLRAKFLLKLNKIFYVLYPLINQQNRLSLDSISGHYFNFKKFVMPTLRFQIVREDLEKVSLFEEEDAVLKPRITVREDVEDSKFTQLINLLRETENKLKIFRDYRSQAQPFIVDMLEGKLIDEGGGYRQVLTDIMDELKKEDEPLLRRSPLSIGTQTINESCGDSFEEKFTYVGALLAFSFLTMQPFSLDLDKSLWKQIQGQKLDQSDLEQYEFIEEGLSDSQIEERVQSYFAKFSKQIQAIQNGMNSVLDGKFHSLAYLPLNEFILRVTGRETFSTKDLKEITQPCVKDEENLEIQDADLGNDDRNKLNQMKKWFWEIFDEFDHAQKAQYLKFVWGRSRMPIKITTEKHLFTVRKAFEREVLKFEYMADKVTIAKDPQGKLKKKRERETFFKADTIPRSHTCFFQFEPPFYTSKEIFKEKLLLAMAMAEGVDDE